MLYNYGTSHVVCMELIASGSLSSLGAQTDGRDSRGSSCLLQRFSRVTGHESALDPVWCSEFDLWSQHNTPSGIIFGILLIQLQTPRTPKPTHHLPYREIILGRRSKQNDSIWWRNLVVVNSPRLQRLILSCQSHMAYFSRLPTLRSLLGTN